MSATRAIVITLAVVALGCARDRGADAPTDLALVVPPVADAAPPTIRPPQRADYLDVPSATPPIAATVPPDDDTIDIVECQDLVALLKRCVPDSYKDMTRKLKEGSKDPAMRAALADICKRLTDNLQQSGGGCP